MSLRDKILARPESAGANTPKKAEVEVKQEEIEALNKELDSEIKAEAKPEDEIKEEPQLTPEQIEARTKDSYEDEIKKLREENAKRRKKEQAAKEKALAMADEVFKTEREEYESNLAKMKKELEELKNLKVEEKNLETDLKKAESTAELDAIKAEMAELKRQADEAKAEIQSRKQREEEEKDLRKQAAENRFKDMLSEIPEEFKDYATLMFNGSPDPSEGLLKISKAKAQGLFGKKTIEVVHQTPKENTSTTKDFSSMNKREKRSSLAKAIGNRRQGLMPGQKL